MTKEDIIKFISSASGAYSPYQIFYDWVECLALATANACSIHRGKVWEEREEKYKTVMNKHNDVVKNKMTQMSAALIEVYGNGFDDVLGDIYMKSGCGNSHLGQFFTPYHISLLMARLAVFEPDPDGYYRFNEPTTGGGANIIAMAEVLKERGINYQKSMKVVAQDLDWLGVYMTYIACSYYGIDAIVVQGDTLLDPYHKGYDERRVLRTPRNTGALF